MASLISMENTAKEAAAEVAAPAPSDGPKYPWGLCITLNDDTLEKLGVKTLPAAGTTVTIIAKAQVTSTSERQTEGDGTKQSMDLQITDMQVDGLERDVFGRAADLLYGKKS